MSAPCGKPTPTGPCRRPVTTPAGPCGANHPTPTATNAASGPPAGAGPGPDPLENFRSKRPSALDRDRIAAIGAASNPTNNPQLLAELAGHPDNRVRYQLAGNPSTPPDVLDRLAADPYWYILPDTDAARQAGAHRGRPDTLGHTSICIQVAGNPNTATATLERLEHDRDPTAAAAARAAHPRTPPQDLEHLTTEDAWRHPTVRRRVAQRPDCPPGVLAELANAPEDDVRNAARTNPAFTGAVAAHAALLTD